MRIELLEGSTLLPCIAGMKMSSRGLDPGRISGAAAALSDERRHRADQILLVAAESDLEARQWTLSLMAAAGRRGVGLVIGEDASHIDLRPSWPSRWASRRYPPTIVH